MFEIEIEGALAAMLGESFGLVKRDTLRRICDEADSPEQLHGAYGVLKSIGFDDASVAKHAGLLLADPWVLKDNFSYARFSLLIPADAIHERPSFLKIPTNTLKRIYDELRGLGFSAELIASNLGLLHSYRIPSSGETCIFLINHGVSHEQIAANFSIVREKRQDIEERYENLFSRIRLGKQTITDNPWLLLEGMQKLLRGYNFLRSIGYSTGQLNRFPELLHIHEHNLSNAVKLLKRHYPIERIRDMPELLYGTAAGLQEAPKRAHGGRPDIKKAWLTPLLRDAIEAKVAKPGGRVRV